MQHMTWIWLTSFHNICPKGFHSDEEMRQTVISTNEFIKLFLFLLNLCSGFVWPNRPPLHASSTNVSKEGQRDVLFKARRTDVSHSKSAGKCISH